MMNNTISILLIDDHQIVLEGYRNLFEAEGFNVVATCENAMDGFEAYKQFNPDVTLLDISMPGKSGLNCIEMILGFNNKAKVIFSTMYDDIELVVQAMKLGAKGFVTKVNPIETLTSAIKKVYEGGFYLSPKHAHSIAILNDEISKSNNNGQDTFKVLDSLTEKEITIVKLVASGMETKEIAKEIGLSSNTIANYRSKIMSKLKVKNSRELTVFAIQNGLSESGEELIAAI